MKAKLAVIVLLLLVSFAIFLSHEAGPLDSPATKENMVEVIRKGSSHGGGSGGRRHGGSGRHRSGQDCGRYIPVIIGGMSPRTSGAGCSEHNTAHSGKSVSTAALLIITAFWLQSLASIYWEM